MPSRPSHSETRNPKPETRLLKLFGSYFQSTPWRHPPGFGGLNPGKVQTEKPLTVEAGRCSWLIAPFLVLILPGRVRVPVQILRFSVNCSPSQQSRKLLDAKIDRKRADEDYSMMQVTSPPPPRPFRLRTSRNVYRGTSLIGSRRRLGPYSSPMPSAIWRS